LTSGEDEPVIWYEGAGTTDKRYLHADERGSIIAVSNSTGTMVAINAYDEFGIPASTNLGRFGYTGQTWIAELGMNYYKARMYSPTLGRFLQTDLLGYAYGMNWYDYTSGDPVNRTDPSGLRDSTCRGNGECTVQDVVRYKYWSSGGSGLATITSTAACSSRVFNGNNGSCFPSFPSGGGIISNFPGGSGSGTSNATAPKASTPNPAPCMSTNVNISGRIYTAGAGPAYARFSGTITDVSNGRSYDFSYNGFGTSLGVGTYSVSGTVRSSALTGPFQIGWYSLGVWKLSIDGAVIQNQGGDAGIISISSTISTPAGIFGIVFDGGNLKPVNRSNIC
jgi:RHS repeat-associated protein